MGWKRLGTYLVRRLVRLPGTPHSIAAGVACGAAVSVTPFIGAHIILAVLLAYLCRGNVLAALVGTIVGNPWTFPFIWLVTYKIGQVMLAADDTAAWLAVAMFHHVIIDLGGLIWPLLTGEVPLVRLQKVWGDLQALIWPMAVGSLPLSLLVGMAIYLPVLRLITVYQEARQRRRERRMKRNAKSLPLDPRPPRADGCIG